MNACCEVMLGSHPIQFIFGRGLSECHPPKPRVLCIDQFLSHELMDSSGENEAAQCFQEGLEGTKRCASREPGGALAVRLAVALSRGCLRGLNAQGKFKVIWTGTAFV